MSPVAGPFLPVPYPIPPIVVERAHRLLSAGIFSRDDLWQAIIEFEDPALAVMFASGALDFSALEAESQAAAVAYNLVGAAGLADDRKASDVTLERLSRAVVIDGKARCTGCWSVGSDRDFTSILCAEDCPWILHDLAS